MAGPKPRWNAKRLLWRKALPPWTIPVATAALGLLCYGLLIPWLGFYWDDLAYQYDLHVFGPAGFKAFVAGDRPFSYFLYFVTSNLFGAHPLYYQMFNLLLRIGVAVAAWWMLRALWPGRKTALAWVPLAYIVYPGFLQQPITFIYNLHWINFLQSLLSLGLMILAVRARRERRNRRFLLDTILALALSLNIFSLEYSFGLEFLRPLLIFFVVSETPAPFKQRLWAAVKFWLPYLAVMVVFLLWTLVFFNNNMYGPEALAATFTSPLKGLLKLAQAFISDLGQAVLLPWLRLFDPLFAFHIDTAADVLFWALALLAGVLTAVFLLWLRPDPADAEPAAQDRWARQALLLGAWAILPAGLIFWGTGLDLEIRFPFDRFTLPFILGVSLLMAGLLELLIKTRARRVAIFSILIGLAVAFQFQNTNTYRREWDNLDAFLWQVKWRMPGLQPGTMLLTHDLPFKYYSDNSLSGVLNQSYAPEKKNSRVMDYQLVYLYDRLKYNLTLDPDQTYTRPYRSLKFTGNTSQSVLIYYSPPGCLRVLDPARPQEIPDVPPIYYDALGRSHPSLIQTQADPAVRPVAAWFPEPQGGWCKAYEQAEAARQDGRWKDAVEILNSWFAGADWQGEPTELGVAIEAQARLGNLDRAAELSKLAGQTPAGRQFACKEWDYLVDQKLASSGEREARLPDFKCGN